VQTHVVRKVLYTIIVQKLVVRRRVKFFREFLMLPLLVGLARIGLKRQELNFDNPPSRYEQQSSVRPLHKGTGCNKTNKSNQSQSSRYTKRSDAVFCFSLFVCNLWKDPFIRVQWTL